MRRKEEEVIKALLETWEGSEIEITASGFIMLTQVNITTKEAAKLLRRIADEVYRDPYFNHNIYHINLNSLIEAVTNEESLSVSESE